MHVGQVRSCASFPAVTDAEIRVDVTAVQLVKVKAFCSALVLYKPCVRDELPTQCFLSLLLRWNHAVLHVMLCCELNCFRLSKHFLRLLNASFETVLEAFKAAHDRSCLHKNIRVDRVVTGGHEFLYAIKI